MLIESTKRNRQPTVASRIDYSSPLANGLTRLLWFGSGQPTDLTRGSYAGTATATVSATPNGIGRTSDGSTTETAFPDTGNLTTGDLTFFVLVRINSIPGNFATLYDKGNASTRELSLFYDTAGKVDFVAIGNGSGGFSGTLALTTGALSSSCLTRIMGSNAVTYFANGVKDGGTFTSGSTLATAVPMSFGLNPSTGGNAMGATYYYAAHWGRVLSDSEIATLAANPWQLFAPLPRRQFFIPNNVVADLLMGQICV